STSRVSVRGPGMLGAGLARLGERLTQLGRTRIQTVQETVLETQASQPIGGMATISTSGLTPPPAAAPPQAAPPAPCPPGPSPQAKLKKPPLFHHLFNPD